MQAVALTIAGLVFSYAGVASGAPAKTRTQDPLGTTFVVSVDWNDRTIIAKLRANPAELSGNALEEKLQFAVQYSSALGCRMAEDGRKILRKNVIQGRLHCRWFD